jgi:tRNA (guanine37-N1)-methyltransferase
LPKTNTHRNDEVHQALEKSLALKVRRDQGQKALQLLKKLRLYNGGLSPRTENDLLEVPLLREPSVEERRELDKSLGRWTASQGRFSLRTLPTGSFETILAEQLPSKIIPLVSKSFDIVGDIAIIELSPEAEPFEKSIAEALTRVHKNVKSVYSKAGPIADSQRLRPLHHVLGDHQTETVHKEHGCLFKIDVSKAFFSPRLSTEHERVARQVRPHECVVDMFAGVGPFSVIIAKRLNEVQVHAIDANVEATRLIEENAKLNKVQDKVRVWLGDARSITMENLSHTATRVIMNHPSQAREFLDTASEALRQEGGTIHYYTFADGPSSEAKAEEEFSSALANPRWNTKIITAHRVRGVAPMKWQVVVDAKVVPS